MLGQHVNTAGVAKGFYDPERYFFFGISIVKDTLVAVSFSRTFEVVSEGMVLGEAQARLIECNVEAVDGAINAVRAALAQGLNWQELKKLIKEEREAGNPMASLIHSLQLEHNRITLLLSNMLDDEEGDEEASTRPASKVVLLVSFPTSSRSFSIIALSSGGGVFPNSCLTTCSCLSANSRAFVMCVCGGVHVSCVGEGEGQRRLGRGTRTRGWSSFPGMVFMCSGRCPVL